MIFLLLFLFSVTLLMFCSSLQQLYKGEHWFEALNNTAAAMTVASLIGTILTAVLNAQ